MADRSVHTVEVPLGDGSDDVVRVLGELSLGDFAGQSLDPARGGEHQQKSADDFGDTVQALGDDADLEEPVQPVRRSEHGRPRPSERGAVHRSYGPLRAV